MSAADRMRALRARRRRGDMVVPPMEVSAATVETLIEGGLLPAWDAENPEAVAKAIALLLTRLKPFTGE